MLLLRQISKLGRGVALFAGAMLHALPGMAMAMELTIKPLQSAYAPHEPLLVQLQFVDHDKAVTIPQTFDDIDVVTYFLLDERGTVIAQGDGYAAQMRQGLRAIRQKHAELATFTLDQGQPLRWGDDVLRYVDVPAPGRYAVKARLVLLPDQVAIESAPVAITVQAGEVLALDAWHDHLPAAAGMIVQTIKVDATVKTVVTAPGWKTPLVPNWGGTLTVPSQRAVRVAEGDYPDVDAHEDERFRWMATLDGKQLRLWSVNKRSVVSGDAFAAGMALDKPQSTLELPFADGALVGRPVQHQDLSVSVYVVHHAKDGTAIGQWRFDRAGKSLGTTAVLHADRKLTLLDSAANAGVTVIAAATQDALPLRMARVEENKATAFDLLSAAQVQKLLPAGAADVKLLRVNVDLKPAGLGRAGVVGALIAKIGAEQAVYLFKVPLTDVEAPDPAHASIQKIDTGHAGVTAADVVVVQVAQDQKLQLHALLASGGALLHAGAGNGKNIAQLAPAQARMARLYETESGYLYALYPAPDKGITETLLHKASAKR